MAKAPIDMTPKNSQISNDVDGNIRLDSNIDGNKIIVTDEATLKSKLDTILDTSGVKASVEQNTRGLETTKQSLSELTTKAEETKTLAETNKQKTSELETKIGNLNDSNTTAKDNVTDIVNELVVSIAENKDSVVETKNKLGDLSTTGVPSGSQGTVSSSIKYVVDEVTKVKSSSEQNKEALEQRLDNIEEKVALNSKSLKLIGTLSITKDDVEAKLTGKDAWLDEQVPVLSPGETASDGNLILTSDKHMYRRYGDSWVLEPKKEAVKLATNLIAGLIKGRSEKGHGYISSTGDGDGTFKLVDYQDLLDLIDGKVGSNEYGEYKRALEAKFGDFTSLSLSGSGAGGKPSSVVEITNKLLSIIGAMSSITGVDNTTVANAIKETLDKITSVDGKFSNYAELGGGEFSGKISIADSVSGFGDNDVLPYREVKKILGDYSSIDVATKDTITDIINSILENIKQAENKVTAVGNKIGDLGTTGIPNNTTVSESLKYVKDQQDDFKTQVERRLETLTAKTEINSTSLRLIGFLSESKETVEGKGPGKNAWLDEQVPVLKPGQTATSGNLIYTSDKHAYYRAGDTWVLEEKYEIAFGDNSTAGIIIGKNEKGHGYIVSTGLGDGTFKLVDYEDIIGMVGQLSSLPTSAKNNAVAAITELYNMFQDYIPKSGGELTGKLTVEGSLDNFSGRELVPAEFVEEKLADKATDADVLHKAGREDVNGEKNFTVSPKAPKATVDEQVANLANVKEYSVPKQTTEAEVTVEMENDSSKWFNINHNYNGSYRQWGGIKLNVKDKTTQSSVEALKIEYRESDSLGLYLTALGNLLTMNNVKIGGVLCEEGDGELFVVNKKYLKSLLGELSNLSTSDKSNLIAALNELKSTLDTASDKANNAMPVTGGEFTGKPSLESSLDNFNENELIPRKYVDSKLGDFSTISVSNKQTITEVINSMLATLNANVEKTNETSDKIGDLSSTGLPQQNQTSVAEGLKYAKTEIDTVKQTQEQTKETLVRRIDELTRKVNVNSTSARLIGKLSITKDAVEAKGAGKNAWLDEQVPILNSEETPNNGNIILTSDEHTYHRYGNVWTLVEKDTPIDFATDSTPGLIKGKTEEGHGYIKSTGDGDGTFQLVDYENLKNAINEKATSRDVNDYKQEINTKIGNLANVNISGDHTTVEKTFNLLLDLIGAVSTITGVPNSTITAAINGVIEKVNDVETTANEALPKTGGEMSGKITFESSLSNFADNEAVPGSYVKNMVGDLTQLTTVGKSNTVGAINEIKGLVDINSSCLVSTLDVNSYTQGTQNGSNSFNGNTGPTNSTWSNKLPGGLDTSFTFKGNPDTTYLNKLSEDGKSVIVKIASGTSTDAAISFQKIVYSKISTVKDVSSNGLSLRMKLGLERDWKTNSSTYGTNFGLFAIGKELASTTDGDCAYNFSLAVDRAGSNTRGKITFYVGTNNNTTGTCDLSGKESIETEISADTSDFDIMVVVSKDGNVKIYVNNVVIYNKSSGVDYDKFNYIAYANSGFKNGENSGDQDGSLIYIRSIDAYNKALSSGEVETIYKEIDFTPKVEENVEVIDTSIPGYEYLLLNIGEKEFLSNTLSAGNAGLGIKRDYKPKFMGFNYSGSSYQRATATNFGGEISTFDENAMGVDATTKSFYIGKNKRYYAFLFNQYPIFLKDRFSALVTVDCKNASVDQWTSLVFFNDWLDVGAASSSTINIKGDATHGGFRIEADDQSKLNFFSGESSQGSAQGQYTGTGIFNPEIKAHERDKISLLITGDGNNITVYVDFDLATKQSFAINKVVGSNTNPYFTNIGFNGGFGNMRLYEVKLWRGFSPTEEEVLTLRKYSRLDELDVSEVVLDLNKSNIKAGALTSGNSTTPWVPEFYSGRDRVNSLSDIASRANTSLGIIDNGIFIGANKECCCFKLVGHELDTRTKWTVKLRAKVGSGFAQWRTAFFLSAGSSSGTGASFFKGDNNNRCFRLETSTTGSVFTHNIFTGSGDNGWVFNAGSGNETVFGSTYNDDEFNVVITCDGTNIIFYLNGDISKKKVRAVTNHVSIKFLGFNGGGSVPVEIRELKVIKGHVPTETEIKYEL